MDIFSFHSFRLHKSRLKRKKKVLCLSLLFSSMRKDTKPFNARSSTGADAKGHILTFLAGVEKFN